MMSANLPVVITAIKSKAHVVRQIASKYSYLYEERPVIGRDDLTKFCFKPLDEAATKNLVTEIPLDVFAYQAIVGDGEG